MYQYLCELCKENYSTNKEQKNHVCDNCREIYDVKDDYIYGLGDYECPEKEAAPISTTEEDYTLKMEKSMNCIMCGKEHSGDYYVCDACIFEYDLTKDQLNKMGGLREKSNQTSNLSTQKNGPKKPEVQENVEKDEKLSTYSKEETEDNYLANYIILIQSLIA